jgi:hypothetical protein
MAWSQNTFNDFGGATSDLFAAGGDVFKGMGDQAEAGNYKMAASLAEQNAQYTATSTAIKLAQSQRNIYQSISGTEAAAAGAGLQQSGSVKDILADSAQQGEIQKQTLSQQGFITEAGYKEQAAADTSMASAEGMAAIGSDIAAGGAAITSGIKGASGLASLGLLLAV